MKTATILSSWENPQDISRANLIFENRNKSYGGYFIRVYYPERIFRAFLFAVFGLGLLVTTPVIMDVFSGKAESHSIPVIDRIIDYFPPIVEPYIPLSTRRLEIQKSAASIKEWTHPIVVDASEITDDVMAQDDYSKANIGAETLEGDGKNNIDIVDNSIGIAANGSPVIIAEEMPSFPGGEGKLFEYLRNNIVYPVPARVNNTEGYVYLSFIIDKTGRISDVKLLRGIGDGCDEEEMRVVKKMPEWRPGKNNGTPVAVQYNLPINFKLK